MYNVPSYSEWWFGVAIEVNRDGEFKTSKENIDDPNWSIRAKVRVANDHPADPSELPDEDLPWAEFRPSTSGQTPQLFAGDIVGGYTTPSGAYIITWVKLRTGKTEVARNSSGFNPFFEIPDQGVPLYGNYGGIPLTSSYWDANIFTTADFFRADAETITLPCPSELINGPGVMTEMDKLIQKVENLKKGINKEVFGKAQKEISRVTENINKEVARTASKISKEITGAINWLMEEIIKKVNGIARSTATVIPINARFPIREGMNIFVEAIYCLFNKILDNLESMIADFLLEAIDYFVNTPLCFVENLLQNLLSSIYGAITSLINGLSSQISGLVNAASILTNAVIDTIIDFLKIFQCEPDDECPETKEWNILDAAGKNAFGGISLDFDSILNAATSFAGQFEGFVDFVYDEDTGNILGVNFQDIAFDLTSSLKNPSCNGNPLFCGPPKVTFWGGGGSGASGNAIVNRVGEIIGIDIITPGSGYSSAPFIDISDDCGIGRGVVAESIIGPIEPDAVIDQIIFDPPTDINEGTGDQTDADADDNGCLPPTFKERTTERKPKPDYSKYGVTGVIIKQRGTGYPSSIDGSLGGRGRVWAEADQTYIQKSNGKFLLPISPGESVKVEKCDRVTPPNRITETIKEDQIYTAPSKDSDILIPEKLISDSGSYPVMIYLCDVLVENSGISYQSTDKVVVTPDNGAIIKPTFDAVGSIISLNIIDHGSEIVDSLDITIESSTGFNAKIIPILCSTKVEDKVSRTLSGDPIATINVIDCVGKV